jgi:hypothetical protein
VAGPVPATLFFDLVCFERKSRRRCPLANERSSQMFGSLAIACTRG